MKNNDEERRCGCCCWFYEEQTDGDGTCAKRPLEWHTCADEACKAFKSRSLMRHYMAVLLRANRYRRDNNVPSIYSMPDPVEYGKAIDFAHEYMAVFSNV